MTTTISDMRDLNPIAYDCRYGFGNMPAAVAHGLAQNTRKSVKRRSLEECLALASRLNVQLGRNEVIFADGTTFENGKRYSFKSNGACYEALLLLYRDRLARLTDAELFAESSASREMLGA